MHNVRPNTARRHYKAQGGLTLVEVVAATALVLLISLSLLSAQAAARQLAHHSMIHMQASNRIQSVLEQQKAMDFDAIQPWVSNGVVVSDNGTTANTSDDVMGNLQVAVVDNGATKNIDVILSWTHVFFGIDRTSSVSVSTTVSDIG